MVQSVQISDKAVRSSNRFMAHLVRKQERRIENSNRRKSERRRGNQVTVGIEISTVGLSVAVVDQEPSGRVLRCKTTRFDTASRPFQNDWTGDELVEALSEVVDEFQLRGQAVSFAIGGRSCVTRTVVGANEDVDRQIKEVQLRSSRYLGLGSGEKVFAVAEKSIDAKRKRGWITVADQALVDAIVRATDVCNLKVARIEHSITCLCDLLTHYGTESKYPVLFVDNRTGRTQLAIAFEGQLLLDYRPVTARQETGREWIGSIVKHIKCLRRYLHLQVPPAVAVLERAYVLGGGLPADEESKNILQSCGIEAVNLTVDRLVGELSVERSEGVSTESLVATWMARSLDSVPTSQTADLTHSIRSKTDISAELLVKSFGSLALIIALSAVLYLVGMVNQHGAESARARYEELSVERLAAVAVQKEMTAFSETRIHVDTLLTAIPEQNWNEIVKAAGRSLPQGMWMESIAISPHETISINGASFSEQDIYDYVDKLSGSNVLTHVTLEATKEGRKAGRRVFEFEISARQVQSEKSSETGKRQMTRSTPSTPAEGVVGAFRAVEGLVMPHGGVEYV